MPGKKIEELNLAENQTVPALAKQPEGRTPTLAIALCAITFVSCILLTVAPLSRIPDPVIQLHTPLGAILAQVGAWLPTDLGLIANHQASQANTNYIEFLVLIALAFVCYGLCALFLLRQKKTAEDQNQYHQISRLIWLSTIAAGILFVFTPAMPSHDILVYASYSRLIATYHANPYFVPLTAYPHDPFNTFNYWADATAAYGPVWLFVCSIWGFILGPQLPGYVLAFRLFALAVHLVNTWLVATILRTSGQPSRVVTLGTLLYAWNPLVLLESSLGGHNDVLMVTFLLMGILASVRAEKKNQLTHARSYVPATVAFTMAALVKFTMLPIIALFILLLMCRALRPASPIAFRNGDAVSHHWRSALSTGSIASIASVLVAIAMYGPFWIGHGIYNILNSFTTPPSANFAENSILLALFKSYEAHALQPGTWGYTLLQAFTSRQIWDMINFVTLVGLIITGATWLWRAPTVRTFILVAMTTLGVLLIITPWFFSWYVTWLVGLIVVCLPLAQSRIGRSLLAFTLTFSVTAFLTYLFKDGYPPFGIWIGPVCLITIVPPLLAFLISFIAWRPLKEAFQNINKMA
jgi:hypothetical protein